MNLIQATDTELKEKKRSIINEIGALDYDLSSVDKEIFYRKNPECRPKE